MTQQLKDHDGEPLLFMQDIQKMTGWKNETIRHYATAGRRARTDGTATSRHMPESAERVRRETIKGDGKRLVVWASVWRKCDIVEWLRERGVYGAAS